MKKNILKLICLVLTVCMILPILAACDTGSGEAEETTTVNNATEAPTTEKPTEKPTDDITHDVVTEKPTEEPTTEQPTTEAPTTEAPTTEQPTDDTDTTEQPTEKPTESVTTEEPTEEPTTEQPTTEEPTEPVTEPPYVIEGLDVYGENMHGNMQNIFAGDTVFYESLMFIDKGETTQLLFPIDTVVTLQTYNGRKTYVEGRDYQIIDGKLYIPETSTINVITSGTYYKHHTSSQMLKENYNGTDVFVYWGEGEIMTQWQLRITYTHTTEWEGFKQESYAKNFEPIIKKLIAGEDVTFIFYGDSITCGATSSWFNGTPTLDWYERKSFHQWSYSMLFTQALADLFGYTIHFVDASSLHAIIKAPPEDYVGGTRGTINYINPSVGGWTSKNGLDNFDTYVKPFIEKYGCDLFGVAFGMNDAGVDPQVTANTIKSIYQKAMAVDNDFHALIVSTMMPNNLATNGWYGNQQYQEEKLMTLVDELNAAGVGTGIARVSSVSKSMLQRIDFRDYTGNNINHPNDFMHRVYAQTCLQAFLGYENIK